MNLLEYQAKQLLNRAHAPLPSSWLVKSASKLPAEIAFPVVAKSQVPVGGRGKAGGVVLVDDATNLAPTIEILLDLDIKGHLPSRILLEEAVSIANEYYLALKLDRDNKTVCWLVSPEGGVDIEENASSLMSFDVSDPDAYSLVAETLNIDETRLSPVLESLKRCFFDNDMLLLEINPLIQTTDNRLLCADAKGQVDDSARFRQPGLPWPETPTNSLQPLGGTIGCIANGAGMAMSTMDTIVAMGGKPANFLDIGGGTGEKEFVSALKSIVALPHVSSVVINIFAGISRCDDIARGIIAARSEMTDLPPLFVRLEGTNRDVAARLLSGAEITIEPDLASCITKALNVEAA